ncbi:hypothetical protein HDA45_000681 [Amycolatopsis umgeniensis]|uniref:Uncharacterized protein n=1 Tax=Amycolatopsis umgeniensis TaxID=336628 RepID=A0A841AWC3_9PSEU|nr:hypothetical protein [Amycolatopsis umgeniensis]
MITGLVIGFLIDIAVAALFLAALLLVFAAMRPPHPPRDP